MLKNIVKAYYGDKSEEEQYLQLIRDILSDGEMVKGRNG